MHDWRLCERIPSLVNIRSVMEMTADSAGTGQPVWARMTAQQAARSSVLFPPMFGPVSSIVCGALPALHMCNGLIAKSLQVSRIILSTAALLEIAILHLRNSSLGLEPIISCSG